MPDATSGHSATSDLSCCDSTGNSTNSRWYFITNGPSSEINEHIVFNVSHATGTWPSDIAEQYEKAERKKKPSRPKKPSRRKKDKLQKPKL